MVARWDHAVWEIIHGAATHEVRPSTVLLTGVTSGFGTKLPFDAVQNYVRFLGYSGREMLALRFSEFDPQRNSLRARTQRGIGEGGRRAAFPKSFFAVA